MTLEKDAPLDIHVNIKGKRKEEQKRAKYSIFLNPSPLNKVLL